MVVQRGRFFGHRSRFLRLLMFFVRQIHPLKLSNRVTVQPLLFVPPHPQVLLVDSVVSVRWGVWMCCFVVVGFSVQVYRFRFLGGFWLVRVSFGLVLWRFGICIFGVRGRLIRLVLLLLTEVVLSLLYLRTHIRNGPYITEGVGGLPYWSFAASSFARRAASWAWISRGTAEEDWEGVWWVDDEEGG